MEAVKCSIDGGQEAKTEILVEIGKMFGGNWPRFLDTAFGGWQLSAVFRLSNGLPLAMTAPNTLSPTRNSRASRSTL